MKSYFKCLAIPFIIMIIGYILLVIVDLIPYEWIKKSNEESLYTLLLQGDYVVYDPLEGWFMDNYTDADCLSIISNQSSDNPFYNALNAYQLVSDPNSTGGVSGFSAALSKEGTIVVDHSYLWNGFQIVLRPLMIRYNIKTIRSLIYLVNLFAVTIVCALLNKTKGNMWAFVPFFVAYSFFNFQMESISLLFFCDFFITLLGCMAILIYPSLNKKKEVVKEIYIFSVLGATVAFFSMLMLPILTLAFPLILSIELFPRTDIKKSIINTVRNMVAWTVSYGIVMTSKVVISKCFLSQQKGMSNVMMYTGQGTAGIKFRFYRFYEMFVRVIRYEAEVKYVMFLLFVLFVVSFIIWKKRDNLAKNIKYSVNYIIVALLPCMWCFLCVGHAMHGWTQWLLNIIIFALLQFLWDVCDFKSDKDSIENDN